MHNQTFHDLNLTKYIYLTYSLAVPVFVLVHRKQKHFTDRFKNTSCGLVTYFIHGALNNFLDIDKIAVPFWGFAAMIVSIELFVAERDTENKEEISVQKE